MHIHIKTIIRKGTDNFLKIQNGRLVASPAPAVYSLKTKQEDLQKQVEEWPDDVLLVTGQIVTDSINYF